MDAAHTIDTQTFERTLLAEVREKRLLLPPTSSLRNALTEEMLSEIEGFIEQISSDELDNALFPFTYNYFCSFGLAKLRALDEDLTLVLAATRPEHRAGITEFLALGQNALRGEEELSPGKWYGNLFEIWSKAKLIRSNVQAELDFPLPSGKKPDARICIDGCPINLECTAITEDDESRHVFKAFLKDKHQYPRMVLSRPGKYCPPNAKGPSPYYDCRQVYLKLYDKIARNLNPSDHQCAEREPNVLMISFGGGSQSAKNPAVGWAFDELFIAQPRIGKPPAHIPDVTLEGWIDHTAKSYIAQSKMSVDFYSEHLQAMIEAPRKLGGILLFDGADLVGARMRIPKIACLIERWRNLKSYSLAAVDIRYDYNAIRFRI